MMNILHEIVSVKKDEVRKLRSEYNYRHFSDLEFFERAVISMKSALDADKDIAIIAEIKKTSPSAGIIREDFDHLSLAALYLNGGANALSVLTDRQFFQGNISYLSDIARNRIVPVIRKDFIIDPLQIFEARAHGADCILLITEILSASQISELTHAAQEIQLEVLLEIHSQSQLRKIDYKKNPLIGINNRNLEDFSVDLKATETLSDLIPSEVVLVSESGIKTKEQLDRLKKTRVSGILVGEHFMRSDDIEAEVKKFKEWGRRAD